MNKLFKIDSFILKIIAMVTMTLDHVIVAMQSFTNVPEPLVVTFRILGALAFPLFAFLIVEGALHTKSILRYMLKLGIMATIIGVALLVIQYPLWDILFKGGTGGFENIFLLLFLAVLTIYLLNLKRYKKILAVLPFLYVTGVYATTVASRFFDFDINAVLPMAIRPEYSIYGYLLIVVSYIFMKRYNSTISEVFKEDPSLEVAFKETTSYRLKYNAIFSLTLAALIVIFTSLNIFNPNYCFVDPTVFGFKTYGLLAAVIIMLYNGKLGFKNKILQHGFYLYYPVHIVLLYGIFYLIYIL